jgi:hypothetical protein
MAEYYDWRGYLVKRNIKVDRLAKGGWGMELDIIAYHPLDEHLIHAEPSLDADSWETRERRFKKKFAAGREFIFSDIFTWLEPGTPIEQVAVLVSHPKNRSSLAGGSIRSVDEFVAEVRSKIIERGLVAKNAIPEQYPLLRTMQLSHNGYYRSV